MKSRNNGKDTEDKVSIATLTLDDIMIQSIRNHRILGHKEEKELFNELQDLREEYYDRVYSIPLSIIDYIGFLYREINEAGRSEIAIQSSTHHSRFTADTRLKRSEKKKQEKEFINGAIRQNVITLAKMMESAAIAECPEKRLERAKRLVLEAPPGLEYISLFVDKLGDITLLKQMRLQIENINRAAGFTPNKYASCITDILASREAYLAKRNEAFNLNTRLVLSIAKDYRNTALCFSDLIQAGCMGLLKAIDKYLPSMDNRFGTYAVWWIKQTILRDIADHTRSVRIPTHIQGLTKKFIRKRNEECYNSNERVVPESRGEVQMNPELQRNISNYAIKDVSLDVTTDEDSRLIDTLPCSDKDALIREIFLNELKQHMRFTINSCLSKREGEIIRLRYGIGNNGTDHQPMCLKEIGKKMGITRERVRQIESSILKRLLHPSRARLIKSFAEDLKESKLPNYTDDENRMTMTEIAHGIHWSYNKRADRCMVKSLLEAYGIYKDTYLVYRHGKKNKARAIDKTDSLDNLIDSWGKGLFTLDDALKKTDYKISIKEAERLVQSSADVNLTPPDHYACLNNGKREQIMLTAEGFKRFVDYIQGYIQENQSAGKKTRIGTRVTKT
jgi:RNA polymerase sigma factor (sigma-70 family)